MTSKARASLGFVDPLDTFDPTEWSPKVTEPNRNRSSDKAAEQAAQASGFRSREPKVAPANDPPPLLQTGRATAEETSLRQQRRRRTGRSVQLNLKARPETITAYCKIADHMGWGLGETLERAVELLEREYGERS
jgi:hypothetical protein